MSLIGFGRRFAPVQTCHEYPGTPGFMRWKDKAPCGIFANQVPPQSRKGARQMTALSAAEFSRLLAAAETVRVDDRSMPELFSSGLRGILGRGTCRGQVWLGN